MGLFSFLKKNAQEKGEKSTQSTGSNVVADAKSWYADRYESLVVQRNLLFVLSIAGLVIILVSVFFIGKVTMNKTIEPMVIEIEEKTGITSIVNPQKNQTWTESRAVNEYFIMKYLRARETYNVASYLHNYNNVVRVMSSGPVYSQFRSFINNPNTSPVAKYGANNSTDLEIRYIQYLPDTSGGKNVQIQFAVKEQAGGRAIYHKVVTMVWTYIETTLGFDDRMINPLGFQVIAYSVAEERNVS